jgi:hypothetical protein
MKFMKIFVAAALAMAFGQAQALHDGGVAHCDACHTMHNSGPGGGEGSNTVAPRMTNNALAVGTTNPWLLQGSDPSSTCLNCHGDTSRSSYHVLDLNSMTTINSATMNYAPGGDFAWLGQGERKGHNVIAADFGMLPDSRGTPPGQSAYNGAGFSCVSCHDPHGQNRYTGVGDTIVRGAAGGAIVGGGSNDAGVAAGGVRGAYRILGGLGWTPKSSPSFPGFGPAVAPPIAVAPATYNTPEASFDLDLAGGVTGQVVVAYVKGMAEWCGTCHGAMHTNAVSGASGTMLRHPSGASATMNDVFANYNAYIKTGDMSGTATKISYDALVPFETNGTRAVTATQSALVTETTTLQASASTSVMCLSCHRAHASAFDSMLRWDYAKTFPIGTWSGGSGTATEVGKAAYNMRPAFTEYGAYQRSLCNKCHAKD